MASKYGKRTIEARKKISEQNIYSLESGVEIIQSSANAKFDESIEVAVQLGVDPKQSSQAVRGMVTLPNGTGNQLVVAVCVTEGKEDEAKSAGADLIIDEDELQKISEGQINFERLIATPDQMASLSKVAKVLGPKGLMPNPKLNTVTNDIAKAIKDAKAGQVEFRIDKAGIIHAAVGKASFAKTKIIENIQALLDALSKAKPSESKGTYLEQVVVTSSMGPAVKIDLATIKAA